MRPTLLLQPLHNSSAEILKCFEEDKHLSEDKLNFLQQHQAQLSSKDFDPVLKYYLQLQKKRQKQYYGTFLLPHEILNLEGMKKLKERIKLFLKQKAEKVTLNLSQDQLLKFLKLGTNELIFWHGNHYLTGAPLFPGGIPPLILFQWGNYFGVVKYLVLAGEKSLKANYLIFFEDMLDRNLNQCVEDYSRHVNQELEQQNNLVLENKLEPEPYQHFLIKQAYPHP